MEESAFHSNIQSALCSTILLAASLETIHDDLAPAEGREWFVNLRAVTFEAFEHFRPLRSWWVAPAPAWDPTASSIMDAVLQLSQRTVCLAIAPVVRNWDFDSSSKGEVWTHPEAADRIENAWDKVHPFLCANVAHRTEGELAASLRSEARMLLSSPIVRIPQLRFPDNGWIEAFLDALEHYHNEETPSAANEGIAGVDPATGSASESKPFCLKERHIEILQAMLPRTEHERFNARTEESRKQASVILGRIGLDLARGSYTRYFAELV